MLRFFETRLIQFLPLDEMFSQLGGQSGKQRRLSFIRVPLLKVCRGTLAHIENNYPFFGLYLGSAKLEQKAQWNGLFTKERLSKMVDRKNYYAVNTNFCSLWRSFTNALVLRKETTRLRRACCPLRWPVGSSRAERRSVGARCASRNGIQDLDVLKCC